MTRFLFFPHFFFNLIRVELNYGFIIHLLKSVQVWFSGTMVGRGSTMTILL